jgi:hypothetical protein
MGFFDNVPVVNNVEDAAGTAATGAVDTFVADPGNALLGVNADNMGIFEENAAGSKAASLATLGLGGEGGLLTDVLMPGQGKPGEHPVERNDDNNQQPTPSKQEKQRRMLLLGGAALLVLVLVVSQ